MNLQPPASRPIWVRVVVGLIAWMGFAVGIFDFPDAVRREWILLRGEPAQATVVEIARAKPRGHPHSDIILKLNIDNERAMVSVPHMSIKPPFSPGQTLIVRILSGKQTIWVALVDDGGYTRVNIAICFVSLALGLGIALFDLYRKVPIPPAPIAATSQSPRDPIPLRLMKRLAVIFFALIGLAITGSLSSNEGVQGVCFLLILFVGLPVFVMTCIDLGKAVRSIQNPSSGERVLGLVLGLPQALFGIVSIIMGLSIIGWVLYNSFIEARPEYMGGFLTFGIGPALVLFGGYWVYSAFRSQRREDERRDESQPNLR